VSVLAAVVISFAVPPAVASGLQRAQGMQAAGTGFYRQWLSAAAGAGAVAAALRDWPAVASFAVSGMLALILWWLSRRRKRKRAVKALGHKARARLAAMIRNMPKPGPVLRPVPQGAGA